MTLDFSSNDIVGKFVRFSNEIISTISKVTDCRFNVENIKHGGVHVELVTENSSGDQRRICGHFVALSKERMVLKVPSYRSVDTVTIHIVSEHTGDDDTSYLIRQVSEIEVNDVLSVFADEESIDISDEWQRSAMRAYLKLSEKGDYILGAFNFKGQLLGCLTVHFMHDLYPGYTEHPYAHLETIIMKRKFRGLGIGSRLVREALNRCQDASVTYIIAQTDEENRAMQNAYLKAGMWRKYQNFFFSSQDADLETLSGVLEG